MSAEFFLGSSFPVLKSKLFQEVASSLERDPLAPKWILVPNSSLANHLRNQLAANCETVLAGLRVLPLSVLVTRLLLRSGVRTYPRWHPLLDCLLFEAVQRLNPGSQLSLLKSIPGGHHRLRSTFLDLADAGFGLEQIETLFSLEAEGPFSALEHEVLQLYGHWLAILDAAGIEWEPSSNQRLPQTLDSTPIETLRIWLGAESHQDAELFVYGFYEFTDTNAEILAALCRRAGVKIFLPAFSVKELPSRAFCLSHRVLEDLKLRIGSRFSSQNFLEPESWMRERTQFLMAGAPGAGFDPCPAWLTYQRASGVRAEAISAALAISRWLETEKKPIKPHEILVAVPDLDRYGAIIREVFRTFALPVSICENKRQFENESPCFRMLCRIWEDQAPAEWLLAYLRQYPELVDERRLDLNEFEEKLRRVPFWGGASWDRLVQLLEPLDGVGIRFSTAERHIIREIRDLWARGRKEDYSVQEARELLGSWSRWLPAGLSLDTLEQALETLGELRPRLRLPDTLLRTLISQAEAEVLDPEFNPSGVSVASWMRVRGFTGRGLVLMGLSAGRMPVRLDEDPLLSDASRMHLSGQAGQIGHRLPVKTQVSSEMRLLFFLLNTSAESLHWVIPETDAAGKPVAPTPWIQSLLRHWERGKDAGKPGRIPADPEQQARFLLQEDPASGSALPPRWGSLAGVTNLGSPVAAPPLHRSWSGQVPVLSRPGRIRSAAFHRWKHPGQVHVTQLESLARCPYRFYGETVQSWRPLSLLEFSTEPASSDWGRLVHGVLESSLQPYLSSNLELSLAAQDLLALENRKLLQTLDELPSELRLVFDFLPDYLRRALQNRLLKTVRAYFESLSTVGQLNHHVLKLETRIERSFPGLPGLKISGKLDRLDCREGQFHIVDYKSGIRPWRSQASRDRELELGFRMQPHLYPWLCSAESPTETSIGFSYVFLGKENPQEEEIQADTEVEKLLEPLADRLLHGDYRAISNENLRQQLGVNSPRPCDWCSFTSVCRRFGDPARRPVTRERGNLRSQAEFQGKP